MKPSRGVQWQRCSVASPRSPAPAAPRHPATAQPLPWLRPCKSGRNASAGAARRGVGAGRAPLLPAAATGQGHTTSVPPPSPQVPTEPVTGCCPLPGALPRARAMAGERGVWGGAGPLPQRGRRPPLQWDGVRHGEGPPCSPNPESCARGFASPGQAWRGGGRRSVPASGRCKTPACPPSAPHQFPGSREPNRHGWDAWVAKCSPITLAPGWGTDQPPPPQPITRVSGVCWPSGSCPALPTAAVALGTLSVLLCGGGGEFCSWQLSDPGRGQQGIREGGDF